jgi:hypothetical protein
VVTEINAVSRPDRGGTSVDVAATTATIDHCTYAANSRYHLITRGLLGGSGTYQVLVRGSSRLVWTCGRTGTGITSAIPGSTGAVRRRPDARCVRLAGGFD